MIENPSAVVVGNPYYYYTGQLQQQAVEQLPVRESNIQQFQQQPEYPLILSSSLQSPITNLGQGEFGRVYLTKYRPFLMDQAMANDDSDTLLVAVLKKNKKNKKKNIFKLKIAFFYKKRSKF